MLGRSDDLSMLCFVRHFSHIGDLLPQVLITRLAIQALDDGDLTLPSRVIITQACNLPLNAHG